MIEFLGFLVSPETNFVLVIWILTVSGLSDFGCQNRLSSSSDLIWVVHQVIILELKQVTMYRAFRSIVIFLILVLVEDHVLIH